MDSERIALEAFRTGSGDQSDLGAEAGLARGRGAGFFRAGAIVAFAAA